MKETLQMVIAAVQDNISTQNIPKGQWSATSWQTILNFIYSIAGIVAVAFIIRGAFFHIQSQGSPDKVKQGNQTLVYAVVGLAVVILAAVLTNFIFMATREAAS